MLDLWNAIVQLFAAVGNLILDVPPAWLLLVAWAAWWLWAVNWKRTWAFLAQGAWAPLLLLLFITSLVWSRIAPRDAQFLGLTLPNLWWQFGAVGSLVCLALFCGWLQGRFGWTPSETDLDPPAAADHGHGHAHH